ncbi:MAG: tetratricopeptide repeat protein, partial [Vulcanimicrobiaceae bacterium]
MRNEARTIAALTLVAALFGVGSSALGAPKKAAASPGPSASAAASPGTAASPTATPEPPEVAIPRLEAKLKANPNDKPTLGELAGYYLGVGKADQALTLTQRLLSLGDKSAQTYYLDGIANQSVGHIKEATSDFEQASNLEPTNSQVLLTLTNLYLQTNRPADAERVAKRAITFNPNDKRVFENYGLVLAQTKKFDEARTQFESAAKLDPKDPLPVVLEARSYVDQKAYSLALQDFDRALSIDPNFGDALLGKARLLASEHNVKDAIAAYEQLLAGSPTDDMKAAILLEEYQVYRDEKQMDQALAT